MLVWWRTTRVILYDILLVGDIQDVLLNLLLVLSTMQSAHAMVVGSDSIAKDREKRSLDLFGDIVGSICE